MTVVVAIAALAALLQGAGDATPVAGSATHPPPLDAGIGAARGGSRRDAVDLTAIDRFWPVYEALRMDRDPTETEWRALFDAPAWRVLGSFRPNQARRRYEIAFRPSRRPQANAVLLVAERRIFGPDPETRP